MHWSYCSLALSHWYLAHKVDIWSVFDECTKFEKSFTLNIVMLCTLQSKSKVETTDYTVVKNIHS